MLSVAFHKLLVGVCWAEDGSRRRPSLQLQSHLCGDEDHENVTTLKARGKGANNLASLRAGMLKPCDMACRLLLPMVVFCFSKKRVDALADNLSRLDLSTAKEKSEVMVPPSCQCYSHSAAS